MEECVCILRTGSNKYSAPLSFLIPSYIKVSNVKKKVKRTLVQALKLCTGRTARRGSRGIALPFHDHGTRRGVGSASRPGRSLTPGKNRYALYTRLGDPQGRFGQVRKISPPTGIWSPDRLARSQSLYRLRYSAHCILYRICYINRGNVGDEARGANAHLPGSLLRKNSSL